MLKVVVDVTKWSSAQFKTFVPFMGLCCTQSAVPKRLF